MRVDIYNTKNQYDLILADPAWKQARGGKKSVRPVSSGTELDYPTCSLEKIKEHLQQATSLCSGDSVLFLWTIIPAAFTVRYGHKYLLYMYKGKLQPIALEERGKIHTVFTEKVQRHSQKPEISYEIINRLYPNLKKLEMYARSERDGFDVWGNEVPVSEE